MAASSSSASNSSLEVFQRYVECTAVPIKGAADAATNQRRRSAEQALLLHLEAALIHTGRLPGVPLKLISDYVLALLKDDPACFVLRLPKTSRLLGFNVGTVEVGRDNALFVTMGTSAGPTPSARCVRMEHGGNNTLVGSSWEIPYDLAYDNPGSRVHIVQTGATAFRSVFSEGSTLNDFPPPWIACYDPDSRRIWKKEEISLVGVSTENSEEIRCTPDVVSYLRHLAVVLFGQKVSPSRMVSVHQDALRLFSTEEVDREGFCRQVSHYDIPVAPNRLFVAATAIPNSNRFIAAQGDTGIIFFSPDLVHDRFTRQHRFFIKAQDNLERYNHTRPVMTMASHSTACATVQNVTVMSSSWSYDWDCGISLWDHESAQRISHVALRLDSGRVLGSWFADNDVLILSHTHRWMDLSIGFLSMIDFRVDSQKVVKTVATG